MGNPLVNELIINTPKKDEWNAAEPESEIRFQDFYRNPVIATALDLVYGVPIAPIDGSPASNRTDLMAILLKYPGQSLDGSNCGQPCSELLRLDVRVDPTPPESQNRLGAALSSDPAGWPHGRRPIDDVTDIVIRVVGGTSYIAAKAGDGVNFLAGAPGVIGVDITANGIAKNFPFLPTPYDSRNRRHVDFDETGPGAGARDLERHHRERRDALRREVPQLPVAPFRLARLARRGRRRHAKKNHGRRGGPGRP